MRSKVVTLHRETKQTMFINMLTHAFATVALLVATPSLKVGGEIRKGSSLFSRTEKRGAVDVAYFDGYSFL